MTNLSEFTFLSSDGKTQLHGMLWEPEGVAVRAVLQICHGVAEHIARYDGFARALNEQGIAVAGHDHLGHGKSLPEGGTPVYFGQGSTWNTVVDDIYILHQRLKQRYPDAPLCVMGHVCWRWLRPYAHRPQPHTLLRYPSVHHQLSSLRRRLLWQRSSACRRSASRCVLGTPLCVVMGEDKRDGRPLH